MQSSLVQVPCKSGSPQGVFGIVQLLAAAGDLADCPSTGLAVRTRMAAPATTRAMDMENGYLIRPLLQKLYFRANCMILAGPVPMICPNVLLAMLKVGSEKLARLSTFCASTRSSTLCRSLI